MGAFDLVCGAECGIVTVGLPSSSNAGKNHWTTLAGTPAIESGAGVPRSGTKCFKFTASGAWLRHDHGVASQSVGYGRLYFKLSDATPSTGPIVLVFGNASVAASELYLEVTSGGVLQMSLNQVSPTAGPTLSNNTWYGVEWEQDLHANPNVIRWRTWDAGGGWVSRTNVSASQAAATIGTANCMFGWISGTATSETVYFDDVIHAYGTTAGEFYDTGVSKGGVVLRYLPTADGPASPHPFNNNDFADGAAGSGFANTATDMYTRLDDADQTSIADGFIRQAVAWSSGTKAFGVDFDTEGTETTPRVVAVTNTFHSAGTGANEVNVRVSDDGTNWTNVWGDWAGVGEDVSDTSAHFRHKVLMTKPSGGAWTLGTVNTMRAQMGQSNDISAVPYYDSISLEVEWTEVTSISDTADAPAATGTGAAQAAAPSVRTQAPALVAATEAAYNAAPKVAPAPAAVAATAAALTASVRVRPAAGLVAATEAAYSPTVRQGKDASAGQATATGAAQSPSESVRTNAAAGTGTGAAQVATPRVRPAATASTATGAASDATVSTASMTNVNAPAAPATGAAGIASGSVRPTTAAGTATEAAHQPTPRVRPTTATAAAAGAALTASVATVAGTEVQAGHAAGVAAAWGVAPNVVAAAQAAASTGVAQVVDVAAVSAVTYGTVRVRDSLTDSLMLATSLVASVGPTTGIVDTLEVQRLAATLVPVVSQVGDVRVLDE